MKRILCLSVLTALTFASDAAIAADTCAKITATGHPEYPAIAFKDGDRIDGAAAILVDTIAKDLSVPLQSQYMGNWSDAQAAARDGKADMIFGIYYNDERAAYLDYVQPAFTYDPVGVIVAKGKGFDFKGRDDLIGKKGVTNQGESYGTEFDAFIKDKLNVARSDGVDAAFDDLLSGKADYMIIGLYPGHAEAARLDIEDKVEELGPPLLTAEMFVAFLKKSPCASLAADFGKGITGITTTDGFKKMMSDAEAEWVATAKK